MALDLRDKAMLKNLLVAWRNEHPEEHADLLLAIYDLERRIKDEIDEELRPLKGKSQTRAEAVRGALFDPPAASHILLDALEQAVERARQDRQGKTDRPD